MSLETRLTGNEGLSSEYSVDWSQRQRAAEQMVLKVVTEEVGGWSESGRRGVPGSVLSKHY